MVLGIRDRVRLENIKIIQTQKRMYTTSKQIKLETPGCFWSFICVFSHCWCSPTLFSLEHFVGLSVRHKSDVYDLYDLYVNMCITYSRYIA